MTSGSREGIVDTPSRYAMDETVTRLTQLLRSKGVTLFAVIDHSGEAEKVGLHMRPTKLLIFGNPRAGTPVMVAAPSAALDLPLKILVWEDENGLVRLSYNSAAYLAARHGVPDSVVPALAAVDGLVAAV
jgi:uncharacterized protein (DUF302 family)